MKLPLLSALLFPAMMLSAQTTQPPTPTAPPDLDRKTAPAACPIHVEEAYLASDPQTMPTEGAAGSRTLHVTLIDTMDKAITSYVMHARITLAPTDPVNSQGAAATITRTGKGSLQPETAVKARWSIPAARFTTDLRRVWFDKVVFADGTTWNKTANDGCMFLGTGRIVQTRDAHTSDAQAGTSNAH